MEKSVAMGSVQHLSVGGETLLSREECQSAQHPQKLVVPSAWGSSEHVRSISMEEGVSGVFAIWRWCLMRLRHETFQYFLMRDELVRDVPTRHWECSTR